MSACHSARAAAQSRAAAGPEAMTAAPVRSRSARGRSAVLGTTVPLVDGAEAVDRSARARSSVLGITVPLVGGAEAVDRSARARSLVLGAVLADDSERSSTRSAPLKPITAPATAPAGVIGARPSATGRKVKVAIVPPPANSPNRLSRSVPDFGSVPAPDSAALDSDRSEPGSDSVAAAASRRQATECSISGTGARWRPNWRATTARSARPAPPP